jgi:hypothetical protein
MKFKSYGQFRKAGNDYLRNNFNVYIYREGIAIGGIRISFIKDCGADFPKEKSQLFLLRGA